MPAGSYTEVQLTADAANPPNYFHPAFFELRNGVQHGYYIVDYGQNSYDLLFVKSTDSGATWSAPMSIMTGYTITEAAPNPDMTVALVLVFVDADADDVGDWCLFLRRELANGTMQNGTLDGSYAVTWGAGAPTPQAIVPNALATRCSLRRNPEGGWTLFYIDADSALQYVTCSNRIGAGPWG